MTEDGIPSDKFAGKVAVVTGASSGIGRRLAVDLARRGAVVIGVARRADSLESLERQLTTRGSGTVVCDVADGERYRCVIDDIEGENGRIDILVNNAGTDQLTPVNDGLSEVFRNIFEVNFFATVAGTLAVLPGMTARGSGIIVNVSSDSARAPEPRDGAYAASKAAVSAFTESVAHEVTTEGVHVHVLYPAWVPTAMGIAGLGEGGTLPPRMVRRTEEQISDLTLARMGGKRIEINAARLPLLAPIARTVAPVAYQKAMRARSQ